MARLLRALNEEWPAFYMGSVAPDYQTICGIPRADTHFYRMPPQSRDEAGHQLLAQYADLCTRPGNHAPPGGIRGRLSGAFAP